MKYCVAVLLVFLPIFIFGCAQRYGTGMLSTSDTVIIIVDDVPTQEEAYDMTIEILVSVTIERLVALENLNPEDPNYDALVDVAYNEALVREAGFSVSFLRDMLRPILADVHGIVVGEEFDLGLAGEYVYLGFIHPDSTQEELLLLLRESIEREEERIQTFHVEVFERVPEKRIPLQ